MKQASGIPSSYVGCQEVRRLHVLCSRNHESDMKLFRFTLYLDVFKYMTLPSLIHVQLGIQLPKRAKTEDIAI